VLKIFVTRVGPLFGRVQMSMGRLSAVLQEDLQGLRVVRAFSGAKRAKRRATRGQLTSCANLNLEVIRAIANNFPFVNLCANLGTIAVVGFGGVQVFRHHLTLGELIAFNSYLGFLLVPI